MAEEVHIYTSRNAPEDLRKQLSHSLERPGRTVELGWFETRSAELPPFITIILAWVAMTAGDELVRECVRQSVAVFREARRSHRVQGQIRLPGDHPLEYWAGEDVPEEAMELIATDALTAEPGTSRWWSHKRRRWASMEEIWEDEKVPPA